MTLTISTLSNKHKNLISLLCGLVMVFAYAPFSLWFLPFFSLLIWFSTLNATDAKIAFQRGFFFGLGWFIAGVGWVNVSIDEFGGLPFGVPYFLTLLLALYLALYPGLACYLSSKLSGNKQFNFLLLPLFWTLAEYFRAHILTGFPWLSLGYTQTSSPLNVFAPVIGESGLSILIIIIAIALSTLAKQRRILPATAALSVIGIGTVLLSSIQWVSPKQSQFTIALIQGNIAQSMRWSPDEAWPTMFKYQDLTRENYDVDLVIWPEAAIPTLEPVAQQYLDIVNQGAAHNNTAIVTGIIDYNFEAKKYFNSLIVLGKREKHDTVGSYYYHNNNQYYKHHLLPIGEFVPFEDLLRPIAPLFNLPMSSFSRGDFVQPNLVANGINILPLICFEIAFPGQLSANLTSQTDIILTVSNDAWFGRSHGPHQHMEIAKMRALEFGRPVVRATNNGITAVVTATGQITQQLPQFEQAVLKQQINLVSGMTPYAKYGNWPLWFFVLIIALSHYCTQLKPFRLRNLA